VVRGGQIFSEYSSFLCQFLFHQMPHSSIIRGDKTGQLVADVTKWTQSQPIPLNYNYKLCRRCYLAWRCPRCGIISSGILSPLGTAVAFVPAAVDDDCGAVGGMRIGRGNRRKHAPVPLCPPQIPRSEPASNPGRRGGNPQLLLMEYDCLLRPMMCPGCSRLQCWEVAYLGEPIFR
jgi:hypothetical protein